MRLKFRELKRAMEHIESTYAIADDSLMDLTVLENDDPGEGSMCEILKATVVAKDRTSDMSVEVYGFSENRPPASVYNQQLLPKEKK